jgi:hypothetical protein
VVFAQPGQFAGRAELLAATGLADAGFPAVKYLRILSRRFLPMPRMASKSSTLLKAPYDLRICKILSAVAGPMPGTCCNSSELAELRLIGCNGGFFVAAEAPAASSSANSQARRTVLSWQANRSGWAISGVYCHSYVNKSITQRTTVAVWTSMVTILTAVNFAGRCLARRALRGRRRA